MGRKAATVEFLERLVDWAGGRASFCASTKIHPANLTAYLSGGKTISWNRLEKAARHTLGEPPAFRPLLEGFPTRERFPTVTEVPHVAGIYAFFDSAMRVIYFGKATDLYAELHQTWKRRVNAVRPWSNKKVLFKDVAAYVSVYEIKRGDANFRHDTEALVLRILVNNTFNTNRGNFKRTD